MPASRGTRRSSRPPAWVTTSPSGMGAWWKRSQRPTCSGWPPCTWPPRPSSASGPPRHRLAPRPAMIPLKDDLPSRSAPVITVSIITLNVLVFLYQLSLQFGVSLEVDNPPHAVETAQAFILEFGLVPCRLTGLCSTPDDQPAPLFTVFSSMFLHGGLFHVAGNMLYLWIFGNNVEDTLGHTRFALFYLLSGVVAAATQVLIAPGSEGPMIGASGAVSGVLGAYLLLFPHARVSTLIIFGFFWRLVSVPDVVVLRS